MGKPAQKIICEVHNDFCIAQPLATYECEVCSRSACHNCCIPTPHGLLSKGQDTRICINCATELGGMEDYLIQKAFKNAGIEVPLEWTLACVVFNQTSPQRRPPSNYDWQGDILSMQLADNTEQQTEELRQRLKSHEGAFPSTYSESSEPLDRFSGLLYERSLRKKRKSLLPVPEALLETT